MGTRLFDLNEVLVAELNRKVVPPVFDRLFRSVGRLFSPANAEVVVLDQGRVLRLVDHLNRVSYMVYRSADRSVAVYAGQAQMGVNFLGLAGIQGPLPLPYTEMLKERMRDGDTIMQDFLDMFNHRLLSLMYRIRETRRVGFRYTKPGSDADEFANYLYALIGLGTPHLRGRMSIDDRALFQYAGLLANETRSADGLESILRDYFQIPVVVEQFVGRWHCLDEGDCMRLGKQNHSLGSMFVLGRRVYDVQSQIGLEIGPVAYQTLVDFLPGGESYWPLRDLVRFYTRDEVGVMVRVRIKRDQVPVWRLGERRLGWETWLKSRPLDEDGDLVVTFDYETRRPVEADWFG